MEPLDLGIDGLDNVELIGRGGSSRVYRALQVEFDRLVAVKVITTGDDAEAARRFDRERKAMGRLSLHEGIVPIYTSGVTTDGEPYLVMPYYSSGSLQDRMERGPVPWDEAIDYLSAVAATLSTAHHNGVVHLDLKPANILLSANGSPRIADFGIARLTSDSATRITGAAFTPSFSSPEALLGEPTSPASDVYGLGATLWALIAGRAPFREPSGDNALMSIVGRVVHAPVPDLRHLAPGPICDVIEQAMAKDPAERYPTAGAFAQALARAAATITPGTRIALGAPAMAPVAAAPSTEATAPLLSPVPPRPAEVDTSALFGQMGPAAFTVVDSSAPQPHPSGPFWPEDQDPGAPLLRSRFDRPVPPTFVPAPPGAYDAADPSRLTRLVLVGGLVVVAFVAVLAALALQDDANEQTSTPVTTAAPASGSTSPTRGVQVGAGGSVPAAPSTASTSTAPTTSPSTTLTGSSSTTTTSTSTPTSASTSRPTSSTTSSTSSTSGTTTSTTSSSTSTSVTTSTTTPASSTSTTEPTTTTTSTTTTSTPSTTLPEPPSAPRNLEASVVGRRVELTWDEPTQGADTVESYTIFRDGEVVGEVTSTVYRDNNLDEGVYLYHVRANGTGGSSRLSTPRIVSV